MSEPLVCAVLLVNGRPEMTRRAIESFRAQTYANKSLLILDTGDPKLGGEYRPNEVYSMMNGTGLTFGALRNWANRLAQSADIIAHFDSDDVSHPRRIEEQVAFLQSSGAEAVGYRELLFWDTRQQHGAAWLYAHPHPAYIVDASRCYWRRIWEAHPYREDCKHPDQDWWLHHWSKCASESLMIGRPRMICGIHGDNTSEAYSAKHMVAPEWNRAPEFDAYCAERMKL
jgi:glycosyltransferase involved in cell wall biosynthesis